ncbi:MAG: deoxyribose-phosphate aldolase [Paludibacteraceae bacterium]|nr:deoxyribose-phosphate aldolase [Prevotellaceae bacterium]
MDRFDALLEEYDFSLTDRNVAADVEKIVADNFRKNMEKSVYSKLISLVDLTSLNTEDTVEDISNLVRKVNDFDDDFEILPHPAGICVYPSFVSTVKDTLQEDIQIVSVAGGFPNSQTFIEVKIAEVSMAVMEGASEIDVVIPVGKIVSDNLEEVYNELSEIKEACRDAKLKVILETGLLKNAETIKKAAVVAMVAGADFIKTSTGKGPKGATLEAAYVMCKAIKEFNTKNGSKVGVKIAGGVSETEDAVKYYTLVQNILGEEWLKPELFRIGASRLVNNLLTSIVGKEVKYF